MNARKLRPSILHHSLFPHLCLYLEGHQDLSGGRVKAPQYILRSLGNSEALGL